MTNTTQLKTAEQRARRWWVRGRRVGSVDRAGKFVHDVGFALLFPAPKPIGPSLWEAVADEDDEPFGNGMGENEQKVWGWKDELPRQGLAWYGAFLSGRGTFLSPTLLAALYPGGGELDDHEHLELSPRPTSWPRPWPSSRCRVPPSAHCSATRTSTSARSANSRRTCS